MARNQCALQGLALVSLLASGCTGILKGNVFSPSEYSSDFAQRRHSLKKLVIYVEEGAEESGSLAKEAKPLSPEDVQGAVQEIAARQDSPLGGVEASTRYGGGKEAALAAARSAGADVMLSVEHYLWLGRYALGSVPIGGNMIMTTYVDDVPYVSLDARAVSVRDGAEIFSVAGYVEPHVQALGLFPKAGGKAVHETEAQVYHRALEGILERFSAATAEDMRRYRFDVKYANLPLPFSAGIGMAMPGGIDKVDAPPVLAWGQWASTKIARKAPSGLTVGLMCQANFGGKGRMKQRGEWPQPDYYDEVEWTSLRAMLTVAGSFGGSYEACLGMGYGSSSYRTRKEGDVNWDSGTGEGLSAYASFSCYVNRAVSVTVGGVVDFALFALGDNAPAPMAVVSADYHF